MTRTISLTELPDEYAEVMRRLDEGETFIVTRHGAPVGELRPFRRRAFVASDTVVALFREAPHVDARRFGADLEDVISPHPTPRG